jgi:hypothetical protein
MKPRQHTNAFGLDLETHTETMEQEAEASDKRREVTFVRQINELRKTV